ncbi:MAG TPA: tetratricopeptide repeat protein [Candidatus Acidoferrum sp.]|nr:tetratricopeptide repeat protein [Candidatus Acidoferrum sp.]
MRSLMVRFCCLSISLLPLACLTQSQNVTPRGDALPGPSADVASVHELQIPGKARAACNKGTKRLLAKDAAGSIPEFQKAIQEFPDYFEAYGKLGAAEVELQRWDDAINAFRKSIELSDGHYAPSQFGLGLIESTVTMQFADAERQIRAGLEAVPNDVTGNYLLGWVLYSTGRLQEAEQSARAAISKQPMFGGARLLLAQIHIKENDPAAVLVDLDDYLALGITGPSLDKVRAARAAAFRELHPTDANAEVASATSR